LRECRGRFAKFGDSFTEQAPTGWLSGNSDAAIERTIRAMYGHGRIMDFNFRIDRVL
jgi:hypothetical protein